jgi:Bacterial membrane protein YfhO
VSREASGTDLDSPGFFEPRPWGWADLAAILVWTVAIVAFFWDAVSLRGALFYFDITEINYPYRAFFADELKAGRFSRWCPGLYCGLPLFSESQAGYLHPFKYLFYPWMETWKALNLDTVLSIWLTGTGGYLWLRRHVGPTAALAGASIFGLSGFTWAHVVHTSMINALASVPFVIWGLEYSWSTARWRGVVLGAGAVAFQTFAGHLQDVILTAGLVGLYGLYRAATETGVAQRLRALSMALTLAGLGVVLSAVQWVPSKELLDRSPRAQGLSWEDLTYGSWHPELLPTMVIREAYGTRARRTNWMDGYYPYHEMNTYVGLIAIVLAVVGAGGKAARDRWVTFWILLVGLSLVLMLGRFIFLFDFANKVPIAGSSREPVRFHLWAAIGVAALAATGVERLGRVAGVPLRPGLIVAGSLIMLSIPILCYIYAPLWRQLNSWIPARELLQFRSLGRELLIAVARTVILSGLAWFVAWKATWTDNPIVRTRLVAVLPLLILGDLLGSHWYDVPTVDPRYWTEPPESVVRLKSDPDFIRVFGRADKSAAEPGYISERIDFLPVRDQLDWSLPVAWKVYGVRGETPIIPRRHLDYAEHALPGGGRYDIESMTHLLTGRSWRGKILRVPSQPVGSAFIHRNRRALPRVRLAGKPVYAKNVAEATTQIDRLTRIDQLRQHLVVEDPTRPLPVDAVVTGSARIVEEIPERLVVETNAPAPAYLVVSDSFDPGWSATVDGQASTIYPAYCAFRAVYLSQGKHNVVFNYSPAGFNLGLMISLCGVLAGLVLWFIPGRPAPPAAEHRLLDWPRRWKAWYLGALLAIVLVSIPGITPQGRLTIQRRWENRFHQFTWGAGIDAMREQSNRTRPERPRARQPGGVAPTK